jgi:hypothetical protein
MTERAAAAFPARTRRRALQVMARGRGSAPT